MHTHKQVTNNVSQPEGLGFIPAPRSLRSWNISEAWSSPKKGLIGFLWELKNKMMPFAAAWMELDSHTEWSKLERERQIPYGITYIWNLIYSQMNLSAEKKIVDVENRLVVAKGEGKGVGWIGSLGLIDANYCLWNGLAMKSCCVALGTMSATHFYSSCGI